ncbi:hypothetical protein Tco_1517313 [Tanacetum coccineum]
MANLIFADSHNMVSYLEKSEDNADFAEIVDFLNASPIRPTTLVADETVYEERGDNVERAATTATSLDTEQQWQVLDLENVKNAQALEIQKLKKRVKKLEKKKKRIHPNRGGIKLTKMTGFHSFKRIQRLRGCAPVTTVGVSVSTIEPSTPTTTTTMTTPIEDEDLTIGQTLMTMKSEKSKAKGVTMQEPSESGTRVRVPPPQIDPKDKGKAKMVEPEKLKKKKDQIEYDANVAQRLSSELSDALESEVPELAARSSKRYAEEEIDQESSKRKKNGLKAHRLVKKTKERVKKLKFTLKALGSTGRSLELEIILREGNRHLHAGREGVSIIKGNSYIDAGCKALGGSR